MTTPLAARVLARTIRDDTTGCWIFQGATIRGYGAISTGTRADGTSYAHRVMYELRWGEVPAGYHVHHRCENRSCCNPDHLEAISAGSHNSRHAIDRTVSDAEQDAFVVVVAAVEALHLARQERTAREAAS